MSPTNPVKVGESLVISCSVVKACENETIQWIWYYNNGVIEDISVGMNGSDSSTSYEISPVKESDNGSYECVANINASLYTNNILLTVKGNFHTLLYIIALGMILKSDSHWEKINYV